MYFIYIDTLIEYFRGYGDIEQVVVMRDKYTKKSRCFGFVVFTSTKTVDEIMSSGDIHTLHGKHFECKVAVPKDIINKAPDSNILPHNSIIDPFQNFNPGNTFNSFCDGSINFHHQLDNNNLNIFPYMDFNDNFLNYYNYFNNVAKQNVYSNFYFNLIFNKQQCSINESQYLNNLENTHNKITLSCQNNQDDNSNNEKNNEIEKTEVLNREKLNAKNIYKGLNYDLIAKFKEKNNSKRPSNSKVNNAICNNSGNISDLSDNNDGGEIALKEEPTEIFDIETENSNIKSSIHHGNDFSMNNCLNFNDKITNDCLKYSNNDNNGINYQSQVPFLLNSNSNKNNQSKIC